MIDHALFQAMIAEKYIAKLKHNTADLFIYNYTQKTQFEGVWNEATLQARGLITDAAGNVVARPFRKFFNFEEHLSSRLTVSVPQEPFELYEKMDGSLGILYFIDGKPFIATRGSFHSEQAEKATDLLYKNYSSAIPHLESRFTYLFEIIYPQNRIVVDYGSREDLVLLSVMDTATSHEPPLEHFSSLGFPLVMRYDGINDMQTLAAQDIKNREGYVMKFKNGFRVKVKFAEYKRLHKLLTQISSISIWENLKNDTPLDELLERVPDEFYSWVKSVKADLEQRYQQIEAEAKQNFKVLSDRKETALYFQTCKNPSILFAMLDGREYKAIIWKMLRPTFEKPFRQDDE
jgi:hypothetical protein